MSVSLCHTQTSGKPFVQVSRTNISLCIEVHWLSCHPIYPTTTNLKAIELLARAIWFLPPDWDLRTRTAIELPQIADVAPVWLPYSDPSRSTNPFAQLLDPTRSSARHARDELTQELLWHAMLALHAPKIGRKQ